MGILLFYIKPNYVKSSLYHLFRQKCDYFFEKKQEKSLVYKNKVVPLQSQIGNNNNVDPKDAEWSSW